MFGGIAVGYLLRNRKELKNINKWIFRTIIILLFVLGASVGQNDDIINNLSTLGLQALMISLAATLGSVLAGWAVYHFFFKERRFDEE